MKNSITSNGKKFQAYKEFSGLTRIFHWIRAFAIFGLIFTGFYIAFPFLQSQPSPQPTNFLQAYIRSWHLFLGFALIGVSIFRLYLFIFDRASRLERVSFYQCLSPKVWIEQIKVYLWVGKHPHIKGAYNPLQFVTYFILAVLTLIICLTGVVLYYNVYHNGLGSVLEDYFKWFEVMCGGLANVRLIHHIVTWAFIIFIPVHIYMVIWNSLKYPNGGADAMISGLRYKKIEKVNN
ncbi:Ni/Fe-hydrogenase, b-type cytochrome subunit [Helicobacter sp. 11S03491-1]|uniref:Ni/Fe-hydrogenase, b-type cytochrome subunit n=1 Tax=Helicobacter sp. 11S03491-1 TaxID=1476196 RepID=UPI000BA5F3BA|nr:Ni/Fe-hydrogenase, b-type cytochrome subunit [Helicobacter sp. 11S03491-1]PAF42004.1 Ni/Fe-hydrogenase, b-type cytochrome subunit [Helicobacter sp. 11S03491-1]